MIGAPCHEVKESNTVREEFMASFGEESKVIADTERVQKALEDEPSMELMSILLEKLDELQRQADRLDLFNMVRRHAHPRAHARAHKVFSARAVHSLRFFFFFDGPQPRGVLNAQRARPHGSSLSFFSFLFFNAIVPSYLITRIA